MSDSAPGPVPDPASAPDTVTEAVTQLLAEGYTADYRLENGMLQPGAASAEGRPCPLADAVVERMYRFEGPSDPGDEMVVFGIRDSQTGVRGSLVSAFGLAADPEIMDQLTYLASSVDSGRNEHPDKAD